MNIAVYPLEWDRGDGMEGRDSADDRAALAAVEEKAELSNANGRKGRAVQKNRRLAAGSLPAQTGRSSPANSEP